MENFDDIRFYEETEVNDALRQYVRYPMIRALLQFSFPELSQKEIEEKVLSCHTIQDFQANIIYNSVKKVIERSSEGLSHSGFEKLDPDEAYLYISNHRDIILDTSLLNCVLLESGLTMTASAIGDNLVHKPFLLALAKLNRNFLVKRGLSPREMLKSSMNLSLYIRKLLLEDSRSVWMAQREGRTKDGNDQTQQGVLKMLAMAKGEESLAQYFSRVKIVPVSISYEFDPTDVLKMPELIAKKMEKQYIKSANEDFNSILKGALGQKGRIHIQAGKVLGPEILGELEQESLSVNEQMKRLSVLLNRQIHRNYKLWPSNYIASDLLENSDRYSAFYSEKEKRQFERRLTRRVGTSNELAMTSYLSMYAHPVLNQQELNDHN